MRKISILNSEYAELHRKLNTIETNINEELKTYDNILSQIYKEDKTLLEDVTLRNSSEYLKLFNKKEHKNNLAEMAIKIKNSSEISLEESYRLSTLVKNVILESDHKCSEFEAPVICFGITEANIPTSIDRVTYSNNGRRNAILNIAKLQNILEKSSDDVLVYYSIL